MVSALLSDSPSPPLLGESNSDFTDTSALLRRLAPVESLRVERTLLALVLIGMRLEVVRCSDPLLVE